MKVNIKFELPDEQYDLDCALNGRKYRQILWDMDNMLRSNIKWNDKLSDDAQKAYEDCRTFLHDVLEGYNLRIDE
jgi:hypothetical protein